MTDKHNIEINESVLMAYINIELSTADMAKVESWLLLSDANQNRFNELKKVWEISGEIKPQPVTVNTEKAWQNVLNQITIEKETKVIPIGKKSSPLRYFIGAAAMIAILFTVYTFWDKNHINTIQITASNTILKETLPDGSEITVNKASSLSYPESFDKNERRVKLEGEAFFDIERDDSKAFIVELPQASYVKVLGTSFNINTSGDDSTITVFVNTGKVEFGIEGNAILLESGEKGILNKITGEVIKVVDEIDEVISSYWRNNNLDLGGKTVNKAIKILNEIFEEVIILDCKIAFGLRNTSDFDKSQSLEDILTVISETHSLSIEKEVLDNHLTYTLTCNEN